MATMWTPDKIAAIFILFGLSFFSGVFSCAAVKCLVSRFGQSNKFKRSISLMNCFAGGIFFATCILDIVPEARENMENAKVYWGLTTDYPLSELLLGIGFLIILTLEHGAQTCFSSRHDTKVDNEKAASSNEKAASSSNYSSQSSVSFNKNVNQKPQDCNRNNDSVMASNYDEVTYKTNGTLDRPINRIRLHATCPDPSCNNNVELVIEESDQTVFKQDAATQNGNEMTTPTALQSITEDSEKKRNLGGFVLLITLSLHMVFDGLSLGLLRDSSKVWDLLLALCLHKGFVFFTIGLQTLELLKSLRKTIFSVFIFSLVSPLGVIIAVSINANTDQSTQESASAILQGIAGGTFLYVTFFEILQPEFEASGGYDLKQVFATIIGYAVIAAFRVIDAEESEG